MDLAFQLLAILLFFVSLGIFLDQKLHTGPWLTLLGLFAGMAMGLMGALKRAMAMKLPNTPKTSEHPPHDPK